MQSIAARPPDDSASGAPIVLFYVFAFLSGVAALIYEVTWAKMLALTFGSTTLSASAVVAGFMGGMGAGAWLYHVFYNRLRRAVLIYAGLELGVAISTALLTLTFYALPRLFADISTVVPVGPALTTLRFAGVFVLLLIPAALMGATFPALCTAMIHTASTVDRRLGMIYGVNTIGAAFGALLTGLVLVERIGLRDTVMVANVINVAIGLAVLGLLRWSDGRFDRAAVPAEDSAIPTCLPRWLTGVILLVSGFCTLGCEILWFRALRYTTGNSTYAFTIVLFVFLVGLGLGSLGLRRVVRRRSPERDLALCQCLIAVLSLAAMACLLGLLSWNAVAAHISIFSRDVMGEPWQLRLLIDAGVALAIMLPATLFMGLSFPLASRLFLGDVRKLGTRVGGAYLLANIGSIAGSIAAAVLLLPLLGTIGGTKLTALVNVALGLLAAAWVGRRARGYAVPIGAAVALVALMAYLLPATMPLRGEPLEAGVRGRVAFFEEGDLATVQVLQSPKEPRKLAMTIDGCKIGWSDGFVGSPFYAKQFMLAHLPMMLDTRLRDTLSVGLGSAATLHALAAYPELKTLDCVEINAAVVHGARLFPESEVLDDPRVRLIVDDALHYLLLAGPSYDLIVSDGKQDPFLSANAVLLCREYYSLALSRLVDDGLFVQWMPLGSLHKDFQVSLRTFCDVFPEVAAFYFPPNSLILVGSRKPIFGRPAMSPERFARLPAVRILRTYMVDSPIAMRSRRAADKAQLLAVVDPGPISRWDRLILDFTAFRASPLEWRTGLQDNVRLLVEAEAQPGGVWPAPATPAEAAFRKSERLLRRAFAAQLAGDMPEAARLSRLATAANPADRFARRLSALHEAWRSAPRKPRAGGD